MPISLKDTAVLFGDTAPHSLSELYGEPFSGGTSAPASGAINLNAFNGKTPAPTEASGTWTHIAVPYYYNNGSSQLQSVWRINTRVGNDTSLFSHGAPIPSAQWPTTIQLSQGLLTPTQWHAILGGTASPSNPTPVGVVFLSPYWTKTANQTT